MIIMVLSTKFLRTAMFPVEEGGARHAAVAAAATLAAAGEKVLRRVVEGGGGGRVDAGPVCHHLHCAERLLW